MKKFSRKKEDFECENCGELVIGDGYTNHCPACLWSKHVDVNPGDRAAKCGGLMKPIGIVRKAGREKIMHQCHRCRQEKVNKVQAGDSIDAIIGLS